MYTHRLAFRHRMQHMTTTTIKKRHEAVMLQNAICNGSRGSHQNSVDGGYVGISTPITVGKYCKCTNKRRWKKIDDMCVCVVWQGNKLHMKCTVRHRKKAYLPVSKTLTRFAENSAKLMSCTWCSNLNISVHHPAPYRSGGQALAVVLDYRIVQNLCMFS